MSFSRPIQWYHSYADPIWPDGTFNEPQIFVGNVWALCVCVCVTMRKCISSAENMIREREAVFSTVLSSVDRTLFYFRR